MAPQPEGWLYRKSGDCSTKPAGYFDDQAILLEVSEGRLDESHEVWHARHTQGDWKPAAKIKVFNERFAAGYQYRFERSAEREIRLQNDLIAAMVLLKQREDEQKHAQKGDSDRKSKAELDAQLSAELLPVALRLDALLNKAKSLEEHGWRVRSVAHGNGALFCFAAFVAFASGAAYCFEPGSSLRSSNVEGWLAFGGAVFFFAWIYKLIRCVI